MPETNIAQSSPTRTKDYVGFGFPRSPESLISTAHAFHMFLFLLYCFLVPFFIASRCVLSSCSLFVVTLASFSLQFPFFFAGVSSPSFLSLFLLFSGPFPCSLNMFFLFRFPVSSLFSVPVWTMFLCMISQDPPFSFPFLPLPICFPPPLSPPHHHHHHPCPPPSRLLNCLLVSSITSPSLLPHCSMLCLPPFFRLYLTFDWPGSVPALPPSSHPMSTFFLLLFLTLKGQPARSRDGGAAWNWRGWPVAISFGFTSNTCRGLASLVSWAVPLPFQSWCLFRRSERLPPRHAVACVHLMGMCVPSFFVPLNPTFRDQIILLRGISQPCHNIRKKTRGACGRNAKKNEHPKVLNEQKRTVCVFEC